MSETASAEIKRPEEAFATTWLYYAGPKDRVSSAAVYAGYREFCEQHGHSPVGQKKLSQFLARDCRLHLYKSDGLKHFRAVKLVRPSAGPNPSLDVGPPRGHESAPAETFGETEDIMERKIHRAPRYRRRWSAGMIYDRAALALGWALAAAIVAMITYGSFPYGSFP